VHRHTNVHVNAEVGLLIYPICPKVKANSENVHFWYKHKLPNVYTTDWYNLHQCLLQPMLHVYHPLLQFVNITDPLLSTVVLHCFPDFIVTEFRPELLRRPHISRKKNSEVSHVCYLFLKNTVLA